MKFYNTKNFTSIYLLFLVIAFTLHSCSGSKSMYKKGLKLEQAGMYSEASNFYYDALKRDITNVDASIRLNNLGQVIISNKLDEFEESVNNGHKKNAVFEFFNANNFKEKLHKVNINLTIPEEQKFHFQKVKIEYIDEELNVINELLEDGKFVEANKVIKEVLRIDPDNQEIRDLDGYSTAEPIYRNAMKYYERGSFKKAFYEFDKVLNYKDAMEIKSLAKEKATFTIIIRSIDNDSEYYDLDEKLTFKVEEIFSNNTNPFIEIIESDVYTRLISERKFSKDKKWQNHSNKVFKADSYLDITINDVSVSKGRLAETRKKGWELYRRKVINEETKKVSYVNSYRKVYYYEYSRTKRVNISVNSKLKSFNTNDVLLNKFDEDKRSDKVIYVNFDGENKNLRSGFWMSRSENNSRDFIDNSTAKINLLRENIYSRRTMKTTNVMESEIIDNLAKSIVFQVDKYSNELK